MGCRTRLSGEWGNSIEESSLRTGNMQWYTLNLPRIAYEADGDDGRLFEILDEKLSLAKHALEIKHDISKRSRITSYNVCYTKLLRDFHPGLYKTVFAAMP